MNAKKLSPTHPGEMLLKEFLEPLGISQYQLAKDIGVQQIRISEIVRGKRAITVDTALRLARYFNMSAEFWLNCQIGYDLKLARATIGKIINNQIKPYDAAA